MTQATAGRAPRTWRLAATTGLAVVLLTGGASLAETGEAPEADAELVTVVLDGGGEAARAAVEAVGGEVTGELGLIDGSTATVAADQLAELQALLPDVGITPDAGVTVEPVVPTAPVVPVDAQPSTSLADLNALIGADALHARGLTGAGVDVAVIDTGIAPVAGLTGAKVVHGPDLSFDSQDEGTRYLDGYGHGTNMAAIIAGDDGAAGDGVAPGARLVNVKVGAANGAVDVSQIIAAIDWVVQHQESDGLDIRVLNLSLGTDGTQRAALDPLAHAVDVAWRHGIVVVAAVGNDGDGDRFVANPALNPNILAVGAVDSRGSRSVADVVAADFSSVGNGVRRPDVTAPGARVLSARVPGSYLDLTAPAARRGELFRGSGTSQATAAVSGAAALLLQQRPELTPAQVKELLLTTAATLPDHKNVAGRGLVDVAAAAAAPTPQKVGAQKRTSGQGSLERARGSGHLTDGGLVLTGERDVFGAPYDSATAASLRMAGNSWSGGTWNGNSWSGNSWSGNSWSGNSWSGNSWSGNSWSGNSWSGNSWSGNSWSEATWYGNSWG